MVYLFRLNVPDFEKVKKFQDEGKAGITSGQREPSLKKLTVRMQLPKKMEIGPGVTLRRLVKRKYRLPGGIRATWSS